MIETKEKIIDGKRWIVTQFPTSEGLEILNELGRILGPGLAKLGGAAKQGKHQSLLDMDVDLGVIGEAFSAVFTRMSEVNASTFMKRLLGSTRCVDDKGHPAEVARQFDIIFAGKYGTLFKVAFFVVEVNYELPFNLDDLANVVRRAKTADGPTHELSSAMSSGDA